jgi:hypothetical protein
MMRLPAVLLVLGLAVPSAHGQDAAVPLQDLDPDLSISLSDAPGVFGWTFGAAGWPNGLSFAGGDPAHVRLRWDGLDLDDLLTGRPLFEAIPVAMLASREWDAFGRVVVESDSLAGMAPVTRVRYESAGDLQAVRALHVQNRTTGKNKFAGRTGSSPSRLQTIFGYAGAGASGEYDGSRLRRAREITARVAWMRPGWSVWLTDVASRRSVGAQAGVIPFTGATYESIYQRLGARVEDESARRRLIRNDLRIGGQRASGAWASRIEMARQSQTLDFEGESLEVRGWTTRWRLDAAQSRRVGSSAAVLSGFVWRDGGFGGAAWTDEPPSRTFAGLTGSWRASAWQVAGGLRQDDDHTWSVAEGSGKQRVGRLETRLAGAWDARRPSLMDVAGFGEASPAVADLPLQRTALVRVGLGVRAGAWTVDLDLTHRRERDRLVHRLTDVHPVVASSVLAGWHSTTQTTVSVGWRNDGRKGLYGMAMGSLLDSPIAALPGEFASARLGLRALLFKKDLDLDAYIRARYWGAMESLRLHTPTGLLVLPETGAAPADAGWLVDLVAEGGVRGATLFVAYENMFSGTTAQIGNLIIPDYPLPRQRTRFGVYWPMEN